VFTKLLEGGNLFEAPRWHEGAWYVSDIYGGHVLKVAVDGEVTEMAIVEGQPSGIGWMPDGSMLIVSMKDRRVLRRGHNGKLVEHSDVSNLIAGQLNDMVVDSKGGAFISTFRFALQPNEAPKSSFIVRIEPDGTPSIAAKDLLFPNGMVITHDGRRLIASETWGARMSSWTVAHDGALLDRRVWAQLGSTPSWESFEAIMQASFAPDGCTIDALGNVWVADALNGRVALVAPDQGILQEIRAPKGLGLYACALGGENGKTLLVCTAPLVRNPGVGGSERQRREEKGSILYTCQIENY
jgi:sugar lactone lactonase YvrE